MFIPANDPPDGVRLMGGGGLLLRTGPLGVVAVFLTTDSLNEEVGTQAIDMGRLVGDWFGVEVYMDSVVVEW